MFIQRRQRLASPAVTLVSPGGRIAMLLTAVIAGFAIPYQNSLFLANTSESEKRQIITRNSANIPQPSIKTDYEKFWPKGIKREFWLNVSGQTISPDGYLKPLGKVLNNTYPGPLIEACWGDDIVRKCLKKIPLVLWRTIKRRLISWPTLVVYKKANKVLT